MGWKAAEKLIRHWKVLRGDNVMIIRGKDKGETSVIKRVICSQNHVIVEGKNLLQGLKVSIQVITPTGTRKASGVLHNCFVLVQVVKKHIKQGQGHEGGIFTVEAPLHASNVQVTDPVTGRPCKVGVKYLEDGTKVRAVRGTGASGSIIPRPEILKIRATPRPTVAGSKDTPMNLVLEKTYDAKTGKGMPEL
ncbi:putative ribosomal protein L24 [Rosa chinensis]|uniref:Putative ribosomal protein L24 n=1 Tax=Rosa chinensis TaxID=74649 RepID=A0A2P6SB55_ROSCH|nr:putative ribosomal protein L24 [Rosa chinensis]